MFLSGTLLKVSDLKAIQMGVLSMDCPRCNTNIREHERHCPTCQHDVGFPNVRASESVDETTALESRYRKAIDAAIVNRSASVLQQFESAVKKSLAVICRPIRIIERILNSDNEIYSTFYMEIGAELRRPQDNKFDRGRYAVDATLFPGYQEEIRFAALSLNDYGTAGYGECAMFLSDSAISNRASVFEENSFFFMENHDVVVGQKPPVGYRATWDCRHYLAVAKLQHMINTSTIPSEFGTILLQSGQPHKTDDFIEVHVFGPITRRALEKIVIKKPGNRADDIIARALASKAQAVGVRVQIL